MFKFNVGNFTFVVEFRHYKTTDNWRGGTSAYIEVFENWDTWLLRKLIKYGKGVTYLHPNDQLDRPFGRKLAFSRAVKNLVPSRDGAGLTVRRMLWNKYFEWFPNDKA